jgi:general secretion pathway protein G
MKTDRRQRTGAGGGFTLLELIVVITIIGILGTLVVVRVSGWVGRAQEMKIKNDLQAIVQAAEHYKLQYSTYPDSLETMKTGAKGPDGSEFASSIDNTKDPWNVDYIYELGSDGKPHARCLGKDQAEGGEGENKDFEYPDTTAR